MNYWKCFSVGLSNVDNSYLGVDVIGCLWLVLFNFFFSSGYCGFLVFLIGFLGVGLGDKFCYFLKYEVNSI